MNSILKRLLLWSLLFAGPAVQAQTKIKQRFEYVRPAMGTLFRIVMYADSEPKALTAANAAFRRIEELNKILSDYDPDSELSHLSATSGSGRAVSLSPDLWYILHKSLQVSKQTQGAFDVTIGPIVQLWRRARRQHELPSDTAITRAKRLVGYRHIILNPQVKTAQLRVAGMQLDMGAIGKGYAVDEAMKVLKARNIKSALVDGGGNIVVSRAPPGTKGWIIDLQTLPGGNKLEPKKIILKHQGIATSGDLYQYVEVNNTRYSHIVNPFTGIGLTDQSHVTVITKNGTDADWLSTSLSVLSLVDGEALIKKMPQTAAIIIKINNNVLEQWQSNRYKRYFKNNRL